MFVAGLKCSQIPTFILKVKYINKTGYFCQKCRDNLLQLELAEEIPKEEKYKMTTEVASSSPSIEDVKSLTQFSEVQESELSASINEENTESETSIQVQDQDNSEEFFLDSSLIDTSIVNKIGIDKSTNLLIIEACNQIITQTINIADFSDKTIKPLKKQLSEIFAEYKNKEDKQKHINRIITCINSNINRISTYSKESSSLSTNDVIPEDVRNKEDVLIDLASSANNTERFFKDRNGRICAAIRLGHDRHLEILGIDCPDPKRYLSKLFRDNAGFSIGDSSINNAITNLAAARLNLMKI